MRYDDWDILLFPTGLECKVPMKEFKVACHVIQDTDPSSSHGSLGIPVMTCFIPSLPASTPFHISVHSWRTPEVSQSTKAATEHVNLVKFEARIFIDGRQVGSTAFNRQDRWPHLMNSTYEFTKTGELEPLRFPAFRRELLYQNHWSPKDDLGRIKIIISEVFPRDSLTAPVERIKNVVQFSFQHAPLEILENNSIAWPNPQMWRAAALLVPTLHPEAGSDSHAHSPRRRPSVLQVAPGLTAYHPMVSEMLSGASSTMVPPSHDHNASAVQSCVPAPGTSCLDPLSTSMANKVWTVPQELGDSQLWPGNDSASWAAFGRTGNRHIRTDTSMPDYASPATGFGAVPEAMHLSGPSLDDSFTACGLKAPTNTPTAVDAANAGQSSDQSFDFNLSKSAIPADLAASLTQSLLNQPHPLPTQPHQIPLPASAVKSRKENRHPSVVQLNPTPSTTNLAPDQHDSRVFSQSSLGVRGGGIHASSSTRGSSGSPASGPTFSNPSLSRHASVSSLGARLGNINDPLNPEFASDASSGTKRSRNWAPASCGDIDDEAEDMGRRPSPGNRLSSLGNSVE